MRTICDKCDNYEVSPCGTKELCHAKLQGSRVSPWMMDEYITERMKGEKNNCKAFKKL